LYGYLGNEKEAKEEDILLLFDEKTSEGSDIHRKLSSVNTISQLRYLEEEKILKVKISDKLESLFKGANVISEWRVVKPFFVNDRRYMLFGIPDKVLFKGNKIYVLDFKNVDFKNSKNIEKYKFQIKFYMYLLKDFGAPEKGYIISTKTGEFIEVSLEENFEEKIKAAIENFESCKKVKA
jgi:CRISPR/Cas system-associated exonuclease Cas4 (RecB family)